MVSTYSAWIEDFNIKPYYEYKDQFTKACKTRAFQDACQAIEKHIINPTVSVIFSVLLLFVISNFFLFICSNLQEIGPAQPSDEKSDEEFNKLKDEEETEDIAKEVPTPKKVKREVKRTPKVLTLYIFS